MHPWKNITKGNTEELETKACFICLERIPCSDDDIELKQHIFKIHSARVHLRELVEICRKAEERQDREGWSIDDVLEEVRDRREADERKRAESGGWMWAFRWKKRTSDCLDNNEEAEDSELDCFLCQKIVKSCEYNKHLEKQHGVKFGGKEIKKASGVPQNDLETGETETKMIRTDADTVKELVEMKYLTKKVKGKNIQRLFSTKYKVLLDEEVIFNYIS